MLDDGLRVAGRESLSIQSKRVRTKTPEHQVKHRNIINPSTSPFRQIFTSYESACTYIYIYIYTCVYIHTYIHAYIPIHAHVHVRCTYTHHNDYSIVILLISSSLLLSWFLLMLLSCSRRPRGTWSSPGIGCGAGRAARARARVSAPPAEVNLYLYEEFARLAETGLAQNSLNYLNIAEITLERLFKYI